MPQRLTARTGQRGRANWRSRGMNWAIPAAPFGLTALASKRLSCQITRAKNSTGSAFSAADCSSARQTSSAVGGCAAAPWVRWPLTDERSLSSGVAGVAPACALAGAFAKASAQASSGPAMRGIVVSFWFDDSKTRRASDRCHRQTVNGNLSAYFGVFGIFEGVPSTPK